MCIYIYVSIGHSVLRSIDLFDTEAETLGH